MVSPGEISLLCRLCLVKDQVNVPIFGEQGDIRQIFLKISSCLPVTVSKEDQLPKNICEGCSDKLDLLFAFWNSSRDAEKTLVSWLKQASVDNANETINAIAKQISAKPVAEVKQETDDGQNIKIQQSSEEGKNDESEEAPPPPKRARRTAAVKAQISISQEDESEEEEDDVDAVEPLTKVEDESDMSDNDGADNQPLSSFVDMPGTSADDQEQAGPSGVGKDGGADAPSLTKPRAQTRRTKRSTYIKKSGDSFECPECHKLFSQRRYVQHHLNYVHKHKPLPEKVTCTTCLKSFTRSATLKAHVLRAHLNNAPKFQCDICGSQFAQKHGMLAHKKAIHFRIFNVHCELCGKGCKNPSELTIHKRKAHQEGEMVLFPCPEQDCTKVFRSNHALQYHLDAAHVKDKRLLSCTECSRTFTHPFLLKKHLRKHVVGRLLHSCVICDKVVTSKSSLTNHMRSHTGEKPFVCEHCGKGFSTKNYLKVHVVVHTKERPYSCKDCSKSFTQRGTLSVHRLKHHPELKAAKVEATPI